MLDQFFNTLNRLIDEIAYNRKHIITLEARVIELERYIREKDLKKEKDRYEKCLSNYKFRE